MGASMKRVSSRLWLVTIVWVWVVSSDLAGAQTSDAPAMSPPAAESGAPATPAAEPAPAAAQVATPTVAAPAAETSAAEPSAAPVDKSGIGVAIATSATAESEPPSESAPAATASPAKRTWLGGPPTTVRGWRSDADLAANSAPYSGLSLRLSSGLGYGNVARDRGERGRQQTSGLQGLLTLDLGSSISDNLVIFGRLSGFTVDHLRQSDTLNAGNAYFLMMGMGLRYHFMPADLYASGALGLALMTVTSTNKQIYNARPGAGFDLEIGKSWQVGTQLERRTISLGFRFGLVYCTAVPSSWLGTGYSAVFSTEFN